MCFDQMFTIVVHLLTRYQGFMEFARPNTNSHFYPIHSVCNKPSNLRSCPLKFPTLY
jgi:hypothetical protein